MRIVVDANIFVSALLRDSVTRKLLMHPDFEFYTVDFVRMEFEAHLAEFSKRSGLSKEELLLLINGLLRNVRIIDKSEFEPHLEKARGLIDDIDDVPYLALALFLGSTAVIWSHDKDLMRQKSVKILSTLDLIGKLGVD
ncbi:PIN domain-containing protein [Candidatus Micrarchaeota archaeon]|nr:PIN domain-containing protein [Candidatus Micrarchaeota archaeon]